jgi:hypothetical protein
MTKIADPMAEFRRLAEAPPVLALDFDGVIHRYGEGFRDGSVYDEPTPGARAAIAEYLDHFTVVILSSRARSRHGRLAIGRYLDRFGFPRNNADGTPIGITAVKPPAYVSIDDRAVTFTGSWPTATALLDFKTWNGTPWGFATVAPARGGMGDRP